jgi:hypothetical protein
MLQGREFKHTSHRLHTQVSTFWKRLFKSHCWASLPVSMPHILLLGKCLYQPLPMDPFYSTFHSIVNNYWERIVHLFLSTHDPSQLMQFHLHFAQPAAMALNMGVAVGLSPPVCSQVGIRWWSKFLCILRLISNIQTTKYRFVTIPLHRTMVSTIDIPFCLSSKIVASNVIIDTGASVCISPHRSDFVTYASSKTKIKDLSSSNRVAGEGLIRWSLHNANGTLVAIELMGYHIPNTDVRLLRPQVLIWTLGGHALLNNQGMDISLDDGMVLSANYCPCTNLPMVPLALSTSTWCCVWSDAFGYSVQAYNEIVDIKSVLHQKNSNLSSSQKEVLLWHQRLLHASTNWIQTLMQDRKWLPDTGYPDAALHLGPFIVTKSRASTCDISNMKCVACLFAKASTQYPPNMAPCPLPKPHTLKSNHLTPGDCVSADHYISPVPGCLPHTFGKECVGYTCGSLFVDHTSGKIFNFPQYSNNASKTIQCAQHLKSMARDEQFRIKASHLDNGIFAAANFQEHCKQQQQKFSFSAY